jgi:hypothetical protein
MTPDEERIERVSTAAKELKAKLPGHSLAACISIALLEDMVLYGEPSELTPVGLLGCSPLKPMKDRA